MIRTKAKSLLLSIMLIMASIIFFACKEETYVKAESIKFIDQSINLIVGEEYNPEIKILPSYATDRSYTLISSDTTSLSVTGGTIKALKAVKGIVLKVEYNSDKTYNDAIVVNIYEQSRQLDAPAGLKFDGDSFSFVGVSDAEAYILKINDKEINIGNNTTYSFANANINLGGLYDNKLECSVRAIGDGKVFTDSESSQTISFSKMSSITNVKVVENVLSFDPVAHVDKYDVVIELNGQIHQTLQLNEPMFELTQLIEYGAMSGAEYNIKIAPSKDDYMIDGVDVFGTEFIETDYIVIGKVNNVALNGKVLSWDFVKNAQNYTVRLYKENVLLKSYVVETNSVTLDCENAGNYSCEVIANSNALNTIVGIRYPERLNFSILESPVIIASNNEIKWSNVAMAENYLVTITSDSKTLSQTFMDATGSELKLDVEGFDSGSYEVEVVAYSNDNNVLASKPSKSNWKKLGLTLSVKNGVLYWENIVENSVARYQVVANNITEDILSVNNCSLDKFNFTAETVAKTYEIKVQAIGDAEIFSSDVKTVMVTKLPDAKIIKLENEIFTVDFDNKANCKVKIYKQDVEKDTLGADFKLNANNLTAGSYIAKAIVTGNGAEILDASNVSVLSVKTFSKLETPTLKVEGQNLNVETVVGATKYVLNENGTLVNSFELPYDLTDKNAGDYIYTAKAIGNGGDILDSDKSEEIKVKKIKNPVVSFDKSTLVVTINCDDVNYVENYTVYVNGKMLETKPTPNNNTIDCSGEIATAGEYKIQVVANPKASSNYDLVLASNKVEAQDISKLSGVCDVSVVNGDLIIVPKTVLTGKKYTLTLTIAKGTAQEIKLSNIEYVNNKFIINILNNEYVANNKFVKLFANGGSYTIHTSISSAENNEIESVETKCDNLVALGRVKDISKQGQAIQFNEVASAINYKAIIALNAKETIIDLAGKYTEANNAYEISITDLKELMTNSGVDYVEDAEYSIKFIAIGGENTLPNRGVAEFKFKFLTAPTIKVVTQDETDEKILKITSNASKYNVVINQNKIDKTTETEINLDEMDIAVGDVEISVNSIYEGQDNVFDSVYSNMHATKLGVPTISTKDGKVVWDAVDNAKYYVLGYVVGGDDTTVILKEGSANFAIKDGVCTYDFKDLEQYNKNLTLQVYAEDGNYLNSIKSSSVGVYKLGAPTIGVEDGEVRISISENLNYVSRIELKFGNTAKADMFIIDAGNLIVKDDYKNSVTASKVDEVWNITINATDFITYGDSELLLQGIYVKLSASNSKDVLLIDSNEVAKGVYGLLAPTNIKVVKNTTLTDDGVKVETFEKITWSNPSVNEENVTTYEVTITYDGVDKEFVVEGTSTELLMPNYGVGDYLVKIKALTTDDSSYVHSAYSDTLVLTVLPAPEKVATELGDIVWSGSEKAQQYVVRLYKLTKNDQGEIQKEIKSILNTDTNETALDISGVALENAVYGITVQAINQNSNISASDESSIVQMIRLPQVTKYCVKDGKMYIAVHKFFTRCEITLTSVDGSKFNTVMLDNALTDDFDSFTMDNGFNWLESTILDTFEDETYYIELDATPNTGFVADVAGYNVAIKLYGNNRVKDCILSTPGAVAVNNEGIVNKLPTPIVNIDNEERGLVNIKLDEGAKTLKYTDKNNKILQGAHLYQITLNADKEYTIYIANIINGASIDGQAISSTDYFDFGDIRYNIVTKNAKGFAQVNFNTATYNMYHYYQDLEGNIQMGSSIELSNGGSFVLRAQMIGDDTCFINSDISRGVEIERYRSIELSLDNGKLKWERQTIETQEGVDEAVYLIEVTNGAKIIVYNPNMIDKISLQQMFGAENKDYVFDTIDYEVDDVYITYNNLANKLSEISASFAGGEYNLTVRAHYTDKTGKNVVLAQSAPAQSVTIIPQTSISIVNGMLSWNLSNISSVGSEAIKYFKNYQLQVFDNETLLTTIDFVDKQAGNAGVFGVYKLNNNVASVDLQRRYGQFEFITGKSYTFKLIVLGDSESRVNSASSDVKVDKILEDVGSDISIAEGVVSWSGSEIPNKYEIEVIFVIPTDEGDGTVVSFKDSPTAKENGKLLYQLPEGKLISGTWYPLKDGYSYTFRVRAKGDNRNISGFFSDNFVTIQRLSTVTGIKVVDGVLTWNHSKYVVDFVTGEMASEGVTYKVKYTLNDSADIIESDMLETNQFVMDEINADKINVVVYAYHNLYADSESSIQATVTRLSAPDNNSIKFVDDNDDGINEWTFMTWTPVGNNKHYVIMISDGINTRTYPYQLGEDETTVSWKIVIDDVFKGKTVNFSVKTLSKGEGYLLDSLYSTPVAKTISASINNLEYDQDKFALYWTPVNSGRTDTYYIGYTYNHTYNGTTTTNTIYKDVTGELVLNDGKYYYYLPKIGTYSDIYVRVVSGNNKDGYYLASQATSYYETIVFDKFASGRGVEGDEYIIANEREFENISLIPTAYYKLDSQITKIELSDSYQPIDNFSGSLDGNGKYIYGYAVSGAVDFVGLFKSTNGATFKNINLRGFDVDVMPNSEDVNISILVASAINTTFDNIKVEDSTIKFTKNVASDNGYVGNMDNLGDIYIGAIAGYAKNSKFKNCEVVMKENCTNITIIATGSPEIKIYIGSMVGYIDGGKVTTNVDDTHGSYTFVIDAILTEEVGGDKPPSVFVGSVVGFNKNAQISGTYYEYQEV